MGGGGDKAGQREVWAERGVGRGRYGQRCGQSKVEER